MYFEFTFHFDALLMVKQIFFLNIQLFIINNLHCFATKDIILEFYENLYIFVSVGCYGRRPGTKSLEGTAQMCRIRIVVDTKKFTFGDLLVTHFISKFEKPQGK